MESGLQSAGKTERTGEISYLESEKAFDSWPSGGRSPLNQAVICKVVKHICKAVAFVIEHSVQKKLSQLYSQVHRCSKHCINFTLDMNKQLKNSQSMWNVCTKVWNSKKISFSMQACLTCKDHCKTEIQPCHVTGVPSLFLVSWFYSFEVFSSVT